MHNSKIGILGAGTMGKQLALLCASRGLSVVLWNHQVHNDFGYEFNRLAHIQVRLRHIHKEEVNKILNFVSYTSDIELISPCKFIIESVKENLSIKSSVINKFLKKVSSTSIWASNTSTLSVTELAALSDFPERFVGLHFFNPPITMKLVEVVQGALTSSETITAVLGFLAYLGKHSVVLPETPGFVVNRLLFPMINEAIFLLSEGTADEKTIDTCMQLGANHPMGPLELADFIGLDICLSILETLVQETGDAKYRPAHLLKKYVRAGKLGRKTGAGFYNYRKRG